MRTGKLTAKELAKLTDAWLETASAELKARTPLSYEPGMSPEFCGRCRARLVDDWGNETFGCTCLEDDAQ